MQSQPKTPLTALLRQCTPAEREEIAQAAGTSVGYLYILAGCHRKLVNLQIALAIEDMTRDLSRTSGGRIPIVTARELAAMGEIRQFDNLAAA